MTEQEMEARFEGLTAEEKKAVRRECKIIKECAENTFFIETGCYAKDARSQAILTGYAMMELGYITDSEFYGI